MSNGGGLNRKGGSIRRLVTPLNRNAQFDQTSRRESLPIPRDKARDYVIGRTVITPILASEAAAFYSRLSLHFLPVCPRIVYGSASLLMHADVYSTDVEPVLGRIKDTESSTAHLLGQTATIFLAQWQVRKDFRKQGIEVRLARSRNTRSVEQLNHERTTVRSALESGLQGESLRPLAVLVGSVAKSSRSTIPLPPIDLLEGVPIVLGPLEIFDAKSI